MNINMYRKFFDKQKPNVNRDVAPLLLKFIGTCEMVKISNLRETKGVDNGDSYLMDYSYDLEAQINASELGIAAKHCAPEVVSFVYNFSKHESFKKGDLFPVSSQINLVDSGIGWIPK